MQLVGYERSGVGSALLLSDDGDVLHRSLEPGTELAYTLGPRHCAGALSNDGGGNTHVPCDRPSAPYCDYHTTSWVCARCTGVCLKEEMDCYEEHAVYIAAFAPNTFKVGVTKHHRLETRLTEQGADKAAHVHTVSNGRIARELEAEIATRLTDRVRTDAKIESLAAEVDDEALTAVLEEFEVIDRFEFDYGLDLETRPVRETMASGTVRGVKGRILVLDRCGTTYAVDMRDLVGCEILDDEETGSERRLQSSLGSF